METICCYCLKEKGIPPKKGDSHGICEMHFKKVMAEMDRDSEKGGDEDERKEN